MRLFVVRHAKAEDFDPATHSGDAQRALTKGGIRAFTRLASALGGRFDPPQAVLASRYERAWATAKILATEAAWPSARQCEELECHMDCAPRALGPIVAALGVDSAALVGHEPLLSELVGDVLGSAGQSVMMRKGAVAVLEVRLTDAVAPQPRSLEFGSGRLLALIEPKLVPEW